MSSKGNHKTDNAKKKSNESKRGKEELPDTGPEIIQSERKDPTGTRPATSNAKGHLEGSMPRNHSFQRMPSPGSNNLQRAASGSMPRSNSFQRMPSTGSGRFSVSSSLGSLFSRAPSVFGCVVNPALSLKFIHYIMTIRHILPSSCTITLDPTCRIKTESFLPASVSSPRRVLINVTIISICRDNLLAKIRLTIRMLLTNPLPRELKRCRIQAGILVCCKRALTHAQSGGGCPWVGTRDVTVQRD